MFRILHSLALVFFAIHTATCNLEATFIRCCTLGTNWASQGHKCSHFPTPIDRIPDDQQTSCHSVSEICCIKTHREQQCMDGKIAAKEGHICPGVEKYSGEYHRDCCEACKLGRHVGSTGSGCTFSKFAFGQPWGLVYEECCLDAPHTTLVTFPSNSSNISLVVSTTALPNLCELLPGELCAHICIPTPDSYRCECRPGFSLMSNGKSCQQNSEPERCEVNNPCSHKCTNTPAGLKCSCRPGFKLAPDERSCVDIQQVHNNDLEGKVCPVGYQFNYQSQVCDDVDECLDNESVCGINFECQNTIASYTCVRVMRDECPNGYRLHPSLQICQDINECAEALDHCNRKVQRCVNTNGSYECRDLSKKSPCPAGYKYNTALNTCEDINECEEQIYVCNIESEICINEPGGYRCGKLSEKSMQLSCQQGFIFQLHTNSCVDVDECRDSESVCDSNQNCQNTPGGYECSCKVGFELDRITQACADVNECQVNQHDCLPSQRCDNTIGSFQCIRFTSCGTGYTLNSQSGLCEDDDECLLGTDTCRFQGPIWQCRNTLGSFRCERKRCERNQRLNNAGECYTPGQTTSVNRFSPTPPTTTPVVCPPGFEVGQNNRCVDINECERSNPCRRNQRCFNVVGTHRCINLLICSGGFELNEEGTQCVDIDECATNIHECGRTQICQNLPGGYTCQCPVGYFVNNAKECVDVDECTRYAGRVCALTSTCSNTPGSYRCVCKQGFRQGKDDKTCEDVDECKEMLGICHQNCINNWGSYRCACESGFNLNSDNRTCVDVDECSLSKNRHLCVGICINMPGSYVCQCPPGYRLGSDGRTCQDIDECLFGNTCHNPNEICLNTRGSFRCNTINCPPFYVKDTEHKNRCKRESTYCLITDQACLQMPTSYTFHFMTFVSNLAIPPSGNLDLFTMRGSNSSLVRADFNLEMLNVHAPYGVQKISKNFFSLRNNAYNQAVISVVKSIPGPQEIELQLTMDIHHAGVYGSSAVAKLFIYVSQYEY